MAVIGILSFRIQANDSTVKGFIVINFADEGIEIDGSTGFGDSNIIQNNWVGIDKSGAVTLKGGRPGPTFKVESIFLTIFTNSHYDQYIVFQKNKSFPISNRTAPGFGKLFGTAIII